MTHLCYAARRMRAPTVSLRLATDEDRDFLREVYASTRAAELALTGWDETTSAAFVTMQFEAQWVDYHRTRPEATLHIVLVDGVAAGRLWVDRSGAGIHVLDIAVLPAWRGRGVATHLLAALQREARRHHRTLSLHVERFNRARDLYERLGLRVVDEGPVYLRMEFTPPA